MHYPNNYALMVLNYDSNSMALDSIPFQQKAFSATEFLNNLVRYA